MTDSIGTQLRKSREEQKLSLDEVAKATYMRARYLTALEEDDFERIPSLAQARGFLRSYAEYLGLDAEELLDRMWGERPAEILEEEPSPAEPEPASKSPVEAAAFEEIGERLRKQRELLGLSINDVARHTHLRHHYVRALESGDLDHLPSPVQGRGMLKNYATFLGLDPDPLLLRFADGLQARLAVRKAAQEDAQEKGELPRQVIHPMRVLPRPIRRVLTGESLLVSALAVFILVFVFWGALRVFTLQSEEPPLPTAPSIADVLLATETASPSPTPIAATPTVPSPPTQPAEVASIEETAAPPPGGSEPVQLYLTVHQRAYVRVTVDGEVEFEGRMLPGTAYNFAGQETVEILTGNGAALQVFFNQQDQGLMGLFGEVVDHVYTRHGIVLPTATITPTISPTPRTTPTPTSTQAPGLSTPPALP